MPTHTTTSLDEQVRAFIDSLATTENRLSRVETIYHAGTTVIAYCASYDVTDAWTEDIEHYEDVIVPHPRSIDDFLKSAGATPAEANPALLRGTLRAISENRANDDLARARANLFRDAMRAYVNEQHYSPVARISEVTLSAAEQRALLYDFKHIVDAPPELNPTIRAILTQTEPSYDALYAEVVHTPQLDIVAQTELALYGHTLRAKIPALVRGALMHGPLNDAYAKLSKTLDARASENKTPLVHTILRESARVINQEYIPLLLAEAAKEEKPEYFLRNLIADAKQRTGKDAPRIPRPEPPEYQEPPVSGFKYAAAACFSGPVALALLTYGVHKLIPDVSKGLVGGLFAGGMAASYIAGCVLDRIAQHKAQEFKEAQSTARKQHDLCCVELMPSLLEQSLGPYLREAFSHPHPSYTKYAAQSP